MNVGITAMPDGGVLVEDLGNGLSVVSLYKNAATTTNTDGTQSTTADMYSLQMRSMSGLETEVKTNFDYYWTKAKAAEQETTLSALDDEYEPQFASLSSAMVAATLNGDTDLQTSLKTSYTSLKSEYATKREAITNG